MCRRTCNHKACTHLQQATVCALCKSGRALSKPGRALSIVHCCNATTLQSTFIPTAASAQAVHVLQLSANKRHLAAAEWSHDTEQQVSVYNVPAQKREQTLLLAPHTRSTTVTALSFRCVLCCAHMQQIVWAHLWSTRRTPSASLNCFVRRLLNGCRLNAC